MSYSLMTPWDHATMLMSACLPCQYCTIYSLLSTGLDCICVRALPMYEQILRWWNSNLANELPAVCRFKEQSDACETYFCFCLIGQWLCILMLNFLLYKWGTFFTPVRSACTKCCLVISGIVCLSSLHSPNYVTVNTVKWQDVYDFNMQYSAVTLLFDPPQAPVAWLWACTTRTSPSATSLTALSRWRCPKPGLCTSAPRTPSSRNTTVASKISFRRSMRSESTHPKTSQRWFWFCLFNAS